MSDATIVALLVRGLARGSAIVSAWALRPAEPT